MPLLNNTDRRVLAQLSIPQSVAHVEHLLRTDPNSPSLPGDDVQKRLEDAKEQGWVAKISENRDPAKVAAHLPKRARQMEDEQAAIYERRLSNPRHAWRMEGDLWVITDDGVNALRDPGEDEPPPMTPSEVENAIRAEHARIVSGVKVEGSIEEPGFKLKGLGDDQPLGANLLEEEFMIWAGQVADDCERRWNVRPKLPVSGGAGWSDVVEARILDWENQKTAMPALVAPWFMALSILAFGDTDTPTTANDGSHIPTYTGYARKSVAAADMNAASGGSAANANAIIFAACTAGSSAIVAFANCEASGTTGDLRKYGTCTSTTVSTTQTPAQFAAGAYTTTAD